jgi:pimeloyl-ACP methyl ester carboxylesterase
MVLAERVEISHGGLTLSGQLAKSKQWPDGPLVLITHGTLSHNRSEIISTLQELSLEYGVGSLAINLSLGVDKRQGPYDCSRSHRHHYEDAIAELEAWLAWLKHKGLGSVFPLGHSRGANQTAWFTAQAPTELIAGQILIAPPLWDARNVANAYELRHGEALASPLSQARALVQAGSADELLQVHGFLYCNGASVSASSFVSYYGDDSRKDTPTLMLSNNTPTLVFIGSEDNVVPGLQLAFAALSNQSSIEIVEIDGADHFFRDLYADELVEYSVEFIRRQQKM